jgi:hypothetical protein
MRICRTNVEVFAWERHGGLGQGRLDLLDGLLAAALLRTLA